jgi:iron complex transport system ATP-binding protein
MTSAITLNDVSVLAGKATLLDQVRLSVDSGEFVALVGPNGAGKSTLLRTVLSLQGVTSGEVSVGGNDVASMSGRERAKHLGWLPQHGGPNEALPVIELVLAARFRFDEPRARAREAAALSLRELGVDHLAERLLTTLSGGEAQRVGLAILHAQEADTYLLDEPANHLDPAQQMRTYRHLGEQWRQGKAVLCVTHDVNLLSHVLVPGSTASVRVVGMRSGRPVFDTSLADETLSERLGDLFGVTVHALEHPSGTHYVMTGGVA